VNRRIAAVRRSSSTGDVGHEADNPVPAPREDRPETEDARHARALGPGRAAKADDSCAKRCLPESLDLRTSRRSSPTSRPSGPRRRARNGARGSARPRFVRRLADVDQGRRRFACSARKPRTDRAGRTGVLLECGYCAPSDRSSRHSECFVVLNGRRRQSLSEAECGAYFATTAEPRGDKGKASRLRQPTGQSWQPQVIDLLVLRELMVTPTRDDCVYVICRTSMSLPSTPRRAVMGR